MVNPALYLSFTQAPLFYQPLNMGKPSLLPPWRYIGLYAALIALISWLFLGGVTDIGLHIHDAETFSDNKAISQNFSHFFSPDKAQASAAPPPSLSNGWRT